MLDLGYKAIMDLLPCYLSIQDESLQILQVNQTFRDGFGEGIGRKCFEVTKGNQERCSSCPVLRTFEDKRVHTEEQTLHLADGRTVQGIVYSVPILDALGHVQAAVELSLDIGRIKEMQREYTLLGESMATLSHEIKNILEGLQGGVYVVDEGIKDGDAELIRKGWDVVKRNISEVSGLVQNILYSSKKRYPSYERVVPQEIVKEVVDLFQDKASALNIDLKQMCNPRLPGATLDRGAMRRLLSNVIWNALEACARDKTKTGHTVVVRADFLTREHFMFEVEDDGVGMDDATRQKLFTESFSTKGVNGTGLGLMIVHKIVSEHGGHIDVLSALGKGSTFRITFPLTQ